MKLVDMLTSELPEYSVKLPSRETALSFRPFLVKEEKTLLLVAEEGNEHDILRAIKNILNNCYKDLDLSDISLGEAEYLFIKLREKSVNENLELLYTEASTLKKTPVEIDLRKIKPPKRTKKTNKFQITEKISVEMREITLPDIIREEIKIYKPSQDDIIKTLACMIDSVTIENQVLSKSDISTKDKVEFIESMTEAQFGKISEYYSSAPSLEYKFTHTLTDGTEKEFELKGLNDFFGLVSPT